MTNHKEAIWHRWVTESELPFFHWRKGILKIDRSVKMSWFSMRVVCSYTHRLLSNTVFTFSSSLWIHQTCRKLAWFTSRISWLIPSDIFLKVQLESVVAEIRSCHLYQLLQTVSNLLSQEESTSFRMLFYPSRPLSGWKALGTTLRKNSIFFFVYKWSKRFSTFAFRAHSVSLLLVFCRSSHALRWKESFSKTYPWHGSKNEGYACDESSGVTRDTNSRWLGASKVASLAWCLSTNRQKVDGLETSLG